MAEGPSRRVEVGRPAESLPPSTTDMKAAIQDTRTRLALRLAQTAEHVHLLYTAPCSVETQPPMGGVLAHAITTIAAAGRAKRLWTDAKKTGVRRRAVIAAVTVTVAVALATHGRKLDDEAR